MKLKSKTLKLLKEAGWYPKRKIDISEIIEKCKEYELEVFETYINFMQEFGELYIEDEFIDCLGEKDERIFSTCLEDIHFEDNYWYRDRIYAALNEQAIPVANAENGECTIYISETGKFCIDEGLVAESMEELCDVFFERSEEMYVIPWVNLVEGGTDIELLEKHISFYKEGIVSLKNILKVENLTEEEFFKYVKEYEETGKIIAKKDAYLIWQKFYDVENDEE